MEQGDGFDSAAGATLSNMMLAPPTTSTTWGRAYRMLRARVRQALAGHHDAAIVQVSVPVDTVDVLHWLAAQTSREKGYWSGRDGQQRTAWVGLADVLSDGEETHWSQLRQALQQRLEGTAPAVRYFGSLWFDDDRPRATYWRPFRAQRFVLPRVLLTADGDRVALSCNLRPDHDHIDAVLAELRQLESPAAVVSPVQLPAPLERRDFPNYAGWAANIAWALEAFRQGALDKVVLARKAVFDFAEPLDPFALLQRLREDAPNRFHFLLQPRPGHAFVGASPERLFCKRGRTVLSEAVAGTRPRGDSELTDAQLRSELLGSEKDQREHAFVRRQIRATLHPLTTSLDVETVASEMKLAKGRHLVSRVNGTLRDDVTSLDVLQALHPTPAVGGTPREGALDAIRRLEPFDRGLYAAPVGWISDDDAEFAVAIRTGLVQGHTLALYSGAGIVDGSDARGEWDEIEHKIIDFINVFGLDVRRA
ncbi:MAG: isochorismate synthase [Bacteroidota bacterium]